ncbi:MAG: F0F1 ATP synthase subunit delta [Schumannella sp.]|nr:F0F1 ATP synthase subunit delta [Microbacteriaceae bacterium]
MGSASRDALAKAKDALSSEKALTRETGEHLLSAQRDIASSPQLLSVLSDPSIEPAEKSALIGRLFSGIEPAAARLLGALAASRWSSPEQLLDGVEEIGIRAIAAASKGADLEAELFAFGRAVASDPELELAVGSKLGDPAGKVALVRRLLARKADSATVAIVAHLVQSPRGRRIGALLTTAARLVADEAGAIVARVTAAAPITAAQRTGLARILAGRYGRDARIDLIIDPSVIGGLRVQVGDDVIDGTIASRIADLRLQLAG